MNACNYLSTAVLAGRIAQNTIPAIEGCQDWRSGGGRLKRTKWPYNLIFNFSNLDA
jgi:hypothetical protein